MKVCMKEKSISIVEVVMNLAAQKPSVMCILTARSVLLILEQSQHTFEDATGPISVTSVVEFCGRESTGASF